MANLGFNKFPVAIDYLNPNIWFSTKLPTINLSTGNIDKGFETASLTANTNYQLNAVVQNTGGKASGPAVVYFFLCQPAPQPRLSTPYGTQIPSPDGTNAIRPRPLKPGDSPLNFHLFNGGQHQFSTTGHFCLVCVLQQDGNANANKYVDANGNAIPALLWTSRIHSSHSTTSTSLFRQTFPAAGVTNFASVDLHGLADRSASSLALRAPDRFELAAIHESLGPNAKAIRDVTGESRVGFFESEPSHDNPVNDDEFGRLPREWAIEGLEPGCVRKVYLGVKLPDNSEETEEISATFMLAEQITGNGEVLGGVAVVAVSRELPVPDSGDGRGCYSGEGEGGEGRGGSG